MWVHVVMSMGVGLARQMCWPTIVIYNAMCNDGSGLSIRRRMPTTAAEFETREH
jgi:hypothetical protein